MPRDHAAAVQAALNVKRDALKTYFDEVDRLNDLTKQDYDVMVCKNVLQNIWPPLIRKDQERGVREANDTPYGS